MTMITVAEQIRYLQQYSPNDTVVHPIIDVREPGNGVWSVPLLIWLKSGEAFKPGDRVRKPGYPDTGTVTTPNAPHSPGLVYVVWDRTGDSYESINDLGRATSAALR